MDAVATFALGASIGATCSALYFWHRLRCVLKVRRSHAQATASANRWGEHPNAPFKASEFGAEAMQQSRPQGSAIAADRPKPSDPLEPA